MAQMSGKLAGGVKTSETSSPLPCSAKPLDVKKIALKPGMAFWLQTVSFQSAEMLLIV